MNYSFGAPNAQTLLLNSSKMASYEYSRVSRYTLFLLCFFVLFSSAVGQIDWTKKPPTTPAAQSTTSQTTSVATTSTSSLSNYTFFLDRNATVDLLNFLRNLSLTNAINTTFFFLDGMVVDNTPDSIFKFVYNYFYSLLRVLFLSIASFFFSYLLYSYFIKFLVFRMPCFVYRLAFQRCTRRCCMAIRRLPKPTNDFTYLSPVEREQLRRLLTAQGDTPSASDVAPPNKEAPDIGSLTTNTISGDVDVAKAELTPMPITDPLASCEQQEECFANIATDACVVSVPPYLRFDIDAEKYRIDDKSLMTTSYVASYVWNGSSSSNYIFYHDLITASPRYKKLITRFAHIRYDARIIIVPSNAIGVLGVVKFEWDYEPSFSTLQASTVQSAYHALGPHCFYSLGDTKHVVFDVPFPYNTEWIENGYNTDAGGRLLMGATIPLSSATGAATSVRFDVYVAFTKVYGRCPIGQSYQAQGLIDVKNITIDSIRDSSLPMNMRGDDYKFEAPNLPIGFDSPADTRSLHAVKSTIYSKRNLKGDVDLTRMTFNACDMSYCPATGLDEMSIPLLMEKPNLHTFANVTTSSQSGGLILTSTVIRPPNNPDRAIVNGTLQNTLLNSCMFWTCETIRFHIVKPAASFLTGKLFFCYTPLNVGNTAGTGAFGFPTNFKAATGLDVLGFPGMIIDLSNSEVETIVEVPFTATASKAVSPNYHDHAIVSGRGVRWSRGGTYALYCMQVPSPNVNIPASVPIRIFLSFKGFKPVYPMNTPFDTLSIQSARLTKSVSSDTVSPHIDDALSVKQYCLAYWHMFSAGIKYTGAFQPYQMFEVLQTIPYLRWYSRYTGSIRIRFTYAPKSSSLMDKPPGIKINIYPYVPVTSAATENAWRAQLGIEYTLSNRPPTTDYVPSGGTSNIASQMPLQRSSDISAGYQYLLPTPLQLCLGERAPEGIIEIPIISPGRWLDRNNNQRFIITVSLNGGYYDNNNFPDATLFSLRAELAVGDDFRAFGLENQYRGSFDGVGGTTSVVDFPAGTPNPPIPAVYLPF